jgi:hypothetical protein
MPEVIYNLTFNENTSKNHNSNIKSKDWDNSLHTEIDKINATKQVNIKCNNIEFSKSDLFSLKKIQEKLKNIVNTYDSEEIYWHITGGQRIFSLAVHDYLKTLKRTKDKIIYVEGNFEELIINDCNGSNVTKNCDIKYGDQDLTFEQVFNLMGFNCKVVPSTTYLKSSKLVCNSLEQEELFYSELFKLISDKNDRSLRDWFVENNALGKETSRKQIIKSEFTHNTKGVLKEMEYRFIESPELKMSYPFGYIFEKIIAYKIYSFVKNKENVVSLATSLKIDFARDNSGGTIIDELDIVLLTVTGKILNFECKSGGMKGDNAKSHNYTTYRLAGVFGMPILVLPLFEDERKDISILSRCQQAACAAIRAGLDVWYLDEIESNLEKLIG